MSTVRYHRFLALAVAALGPGLLFAHCGGGCAGGLSGSDVCGPPVYGYAQVHGRAALLDGTPVAGKEAYIACGDVVGAPSDRTDRQGRFQVDLVYAVFDTLRYPFPPRDTDGGFRLDCRASLVVSAELSLVQEPVAVDFATSRAAVVPSEVALLEAAP